MKMQMKASFAKLWAEQLWKAMGATGKGYRHFKQNRSGVGEDRRKDKLERNDTRLTRQYQRRYGAA